MTAILKEYHKLKIPIVNELEKVYYGKKETLSNELEDNLNGYPKCLVGTVREKLGLEKGENEDYYNQCGTCYNIAGRFATVYDKLVTYHEYVKDLEHTFEKFEYQRKLEESKEEYQALLLDFKRHLRMIHKKEIDV